MNTYKIGNESKFKSDVRTTAERAVDAIRNTAFAIEEAQQTLRLLMEKQQLQCRQILLDPIVPPYTKIFIRADYLSPLGHLAKQRVYAGLALSDEVWLATNKLDRASLNRADSALLEGLD